MALLTKSEGMALLLVLSFMALSLMWLGSGLAWPWGAMSSSAPTAICTMVRNEPEAYVAEWVAFHLMQGFQQILIVDDQSDNSAQLALALQPYKQRVRIVSTPAPGIADCDDLTSHR